MTKTEPSPLVDSLTRASDWIRERTLQKVISGRIPILDTDAAIEYWVCAFAVVSVGALLLAPSDRLGAIVICILAILRLEEIVVNVSYVTLFHGRIKARNITGRRRIVVLLLLNYVEVVFWFAAVFHLMNLPSGAPGIDSRLAALSFSLNNASGVGSSPILASSNLALGLALLESAIGLFMIIGVLARFIGALPPFTTRTRGD